MTEYVALLRGIGPGNPNMRNEKLRGVLDGLGFESTTILRTRQQLEQLVADNPFGGIEDVDSSRLQATFLKHEPNTALDLPHTPSDGDYTVVAIVDRTVCSTVDLTGSRTPDLMRWLERTFGKEITTRTWKTVHRIVKRMADDK